MVAALRLFAFVSVVPEAVGLSQVQKKDVTGPLHDKGKARTADYNPLSDLGHALHSVADKLTHGRDARAETEAVASLEAKAAHPHVASFGDSGLTGHRSHEKVATTKLAGHRSETTATNHKHGGDQSAATVTEDKRAGRRSDATLTKTKSASAHRLADVQTLKAAAGVEYTTKVNSEQRTLLGDFSRVQNPVFEEMCRGMTDCKLSVCRWLQLSEEDTGSGPCHLFESNLNTCKGWVAPENRAEDALSEDVDCAVEHLRHASVGPAGVAEKVDKIEACLDDMTEETRSNCVVAMTLLTDSIAEWRKLQALDVELGHIRAALDKEMPRARAALSERAEEQEAEAAALRPIVARAVNASSAEFVDQIVEARDLLDKLDKIPPVREQLRVALKRAEDSFTSHNLFKVRKAIAWLDVALLEGAKTKVAIGSPVPEAKAMLVRLIKLNKALEDLSTATQVANVSVLSRSGVWQGLQGLKDAVQASEAAGLRPVALKDAKELLEKLRELHSAVAVLEVRTREAQSVLGPDGNKGPVSLSHAIHKLNHSLLVAEGLGLSDNASVAAAVGVMDSLSYTYAARRQLDAVVAASQKLLLEDGDELSAAREEAMIDLLTPAIAWGKDVGFTSSIPPAEEELARLTHMRDLKQRMRLALAKGNWSLGSKTGLYDAQHQLQAALQGVAEVPAGKELAERLLESVNALLEARSNLEKAESVVNGVMKRNVGYESAAARLNRTIADAEALGFDLEVDVAKEKLDQLEAFIRAKEGLERAAALTPPKRERGFPGVEENYTHVELKKHALEPKDLGDLSEFADDQDSDFDEHIQALHDAMRSAAAEGFVDPKQQAALARLRAAKEAAAQLKSAARYGAAALTTKEHVVEAVTTLRAAIIDAEQAGVVLHLASARSLLAKLLPIEPAREELIGAVLQGNTSIKTEYDLNKASVRLHEAIELNHDLYLNKSLEAAHAMSVLVDEKNEALLDIKAAIISGEEAAKTDVGVSDAIEELSEAVAQAHAANLTRQVDVAELLLHELSNRQSISREVEQSLEGTN